MKPKESLDLLLHIRQQLIQPRYDQGELSGYLAPSTENISWLQALASAGLTEDVVLLNGEYVPLETLAVYDNETVHLSHRLPAAPAENSNIPVMLYTNNLQQCRYYETVNEFLQHNSYQYPAFLFYIQEIHFTSTDVVIPFTISQYKDVLGMIELLVSIADYIIENIGEPKEIVLFAKRKLSIMVQYNQNHLRHLPFLSQLQTQLHEAHDKEERKSIFITEMIAVLFPFPAPERFNKLLSSLNLIYDHYLKSHALYVEKFSYHDLKAKIDKDRLDFTKKIYATVNDIQSRMIAVPAAFLLILTQWDRTDSWSYKNIITTAGTILFSVLLEILLRNQFGVLRYVEGEMLQFKSELGHSSANLDLSEFTTSFSHLQAVANKQRVYLWIFRIIVWLVPATALVLFFWR